MWAGKEVGVFYASIWGHHRDIASKKNITWEIIKNRYLFNTIPFDATEMSEKKIRKFIDMFNHRKPEVLVAYANSMFFIAKFILEKDINITHIPKSIITTAEFLDPERRTIIEKVFGCQIYNRYGCRETSVMLANAALEMECI